MNITQFDTAGDVCNTSIVDLVNINTNCGWMTCGNPKRRGKIGQKHRSTGKHLHLHTDYNPISFPCQIITDCTATLGCKDNEDG